MVRQADFRVAAEAYRAIAASSSARARARSYRNRVVALCTAFHRDLQLGARPTLREVRTQEVLTLRLEAELPRRLPMMCYLRQTAAVRAEDDRLPAQVVRVAEPGRLTLHPGYRIALERTGMRLSRQYVEGSFVFGWFDRRLDQVCRDCDERLRGLRKLTVPRPILRLPMSCATASLIFLMPQSTAPAHAAYPAPWLVSCPRSRAGRDANVSLTRQVYLPGAGPARFTDADNSGQPAPAGRGLVVSLGDPYRSQCRDTLPLVPGLH